jgi:hypothetical protein
MHRRPSSAPALAAAAAALLLLAGCGAPKSSGPAPGGAKTHATPAATLFPPGPYAAVMIDNAPQARPQSGLDQAPLVYELMAEGGITRYMAFFPLKADVPEIGPVRSARIGFIDIDEAYGVPYAHAGGNVDALATLAHGALPNLDAIYGSGATFWRSSSRSAPHNLYTSSALLLKAVTQDGYPEKNLLAWPLGPVPSGGEPTVGATIVYAWYPPVYTYTAGWQWDGHRYLRFVNGQPDVTLAGQRIAAADVVILHVVSEPDPDPYTPGALRYVLTSGDGWLLRDGRRWPIRWTFSTQGGFRFTLADGRPAPFTPGHVWVEVVNPSIQPEFQK